MTNALYKYTILYVKDVVATVEFYEQAFDLKRGLVTPETDYGEVITGDTTLSFASLELGNSNIKSGFTTSSPDTKPFGVELAFVAESIDETWKQAIKAGATILEDIVEKPRGQQVGYLRDPNGFLLEICTPMK